MEVKNTPLVQAKHFIMGFVFVTPVLSAPIKLGNRTMLGCVSHTTQDPQMLEI